MIRFRKDTPRYWFMNEQKLAGKHFQQRVVHCKLNHITYTLPLFSYRNGGFFRKGDHK